MSSDCKKLTIALHLKIFDDNDWHLIIDEDSGSTQDLALAVRKHLEVPSVNTDLDADNDDFLFSGSSNNHFFPNRRDVLAVDVRVPSENVIFTVMVMHTKARNGGRTTTEQRRVGSSIAMAQKLEVDYDGKLVAIVGDMTRPMINR